MPPGSLGRVPGLCPPARGAPLTQPGAEQAAEGEARGQRAAQNFPFPPVLGGKPQRHQSKEPLGSRLAAFSFRW